MPVITPATTTNSNNAKSANKSSIVILFDMWVLRVVSFP